MVVFGMLLNKGTLKNLKVTLGKLISKSFKPLGNLRSFKEPVKDNSILGEEILNRNNILGNKGMP